MFLIKLQEKGLISNQQFEFLKSHKMHLLRLFKSHINLKILCDKNWYFYLSIKQLVTLEIVISSLSGGIFKNTTVEFYIFSRSSDLTIHPLKSHLKGMLQQGLNSNNSISFRILQQIS